MILGDVTLYIFLFAALLAIFTSATGTLFGAGFIVPQALGRYTMFGDKAFRWTVVGYIVLASISAF